MGARSTTAGGVALVVLAVALTVGLASPWAHGGTVHEVIVRDFEFDPAEVTIEPGDTVHWVWESGLHTVTSGIDCTPDQLYFNEPISVAIPEFSYTIPEDTELDHIDYFCIPHCKNMIGVILIDQGGNPADLNGDGDVNVVDLLILLGKWGSCDGCPADLNGDGAVGVIDLLMLLSAW